jgi:ligand-binding sensor domain-containing protein
MCAILVVTASSALTAHAQRATRDWSPQDRVVLGNFSVIRALASSVERVFVVGVSGVAVWRPLEQKWEGPFIPPEPRMLDRAFAALVDPLDQSLWIARTDGWVNFRPELELWQGGYVPGGVRALAIDQDDIAGGIRLQAGGRWYKVMTGSTVAVPSQAPVRPLAPMSVEDLFRANPSLRSTATLVLRDARGRQAQFTAAAESPDRMGWYIGTSGLGLLFLRTGDLTPERLTFGLAGEVAGAVFTAPGGVWVATDRTPVSDATLTFVSQDLSRSEKFTGSATFGLGYTHARMLVGSEQSLYLATDAGVTQVNLAQSATRFFDMGKGLPDSRANVVLARRGGVLVGTPRGLALITAEGAVQRLGKQFIEPVTALAAEGDSIWIGAVDGLLLLPPEADAPGRTPGLRASAALRAPVLELAWLADTLVALLPDRLLWRAPGTDSWTLGPVIGGNLGRLRRFTLAGNGFFVAGERGVGYVRLRSPLQNPLREGDLPGPVRDLEADERFLWVATERGLVRFRLEAILP